MKKYLVLFFLVTFTSTKYAFSQNTANPQRYLIHGILNSNGGYNALPLISRMVNSGCNAVELTVFWDRVYPTANAKADYQQLDAQINYALGLGVKIAIRIDVARNIDLINGFWTPEQAVMDYYGKVLTVNYNNDHFSFAHQPSIDKAKAFVQEVCLRYKNLQQNGKIIFISVVNTPQQELGYTYENQQWPSPSYATVFDHSKYSMAGLRAWASDKYQTIATLNAYWGTSFKSFSEVEPYVNQPEPQNSFKGYRGKEWYLYRHITLKNYIDQMASAIKSVDSTYLVAAEFGSVTDNASTLRCSLGFKSLCSNVDIVKSLMAGFETDVLRSNLLPNKAIGSEAAAFDFPTNVAINDYMTQVFQNGSKYGVLYAGTDSEVDKVTLAAVQQSIWKNIPINTIQTFGKQTYRLSEIIDVREDVMNTWNSLSANGTKPVEVKIIEDFIDDNVKIANPLPDNPTPTTPTTPSTPIQPPINVDTTKVNIPPVERKKFDTQDIVYNQNFIITFPNNIVTDPDGYIASIQLIEAPTWVQFNKFGYVFTGKPPTFGQFLIKLRAYDNRGAWVETTFYLKVIPPQITFELIKAGYFDVPIVGLGFMTDQRVLYYSYLPDTLNMLARCNVDSVNFVFELSGPYKYSRVSYRSPYSLFLEGRGMQFPIGTYQLTATAYHIKTDSLITTSTISFSVKNSQIETSNKLAIWRTYPNPFEDICNIQLPDSEEVTKLNYLIKTIDGKNICIPNSAVSVVEKVAYIDTSYLTILGGIYFVEVWKEGTMLKRMKIAKY